MANVSLKKNFLDGDKLFAAQLNNNFSAIEAALAAMNKIVWQDDDNDDVVTFRGTTEELEERDIIDGQLLYNIETGETYIDYNGSRISTGSGNAIHIGSDTPTNPATELWIDPSSATLPVNAEIKKITGSFTIDSSSHNEDINYPTGFTYSNCTIIVAQFTQDDFTTKYPMPMFFFDNNNDLIGSIWALLNDYNNKIRIATQGSFFTTNMKINYEIVLMKTE